jgi:Flp pilus assembly protein TadD
MAKFKGFAKSLKDEDSSKRSDRLNSSKQSAPANPEALNLARQYYQMGRLDQAEQAYQQILREQPEQTEALHRLGIMAQRSGKSEKAVNYLRKAIACDPQDSSLPNSLGIILAEQGQLPEAVNSFQQAIALNPNHFNAYSNLGNTLRMQGKLQEAIVSLQTALDLNADWVPAHGNLGVAYLEQENFDLAETHLRRAIAINPNYVDAHYNLGIVLDKQKQPEQAIASYSKAIALAPGYLKAYVALGNLLQAEGQVESAILNFEQALAIDPKNADVYTGLAVALNSQGDAEAAIARLRQAIALNPNHARAYTCLGGVMWRQGKLEQATNHYRTATQLEPDQAEAHLGLAQSLLAIGDFRGGFAEFEWRWKLVPFSSLSQPLWDGSNLQGETILLRAEGGFGDIIQFVRYAALVAEAGRVILVCQPSLQRLLATAPGVDQVVVEGDLPEFQAQAPLMSLPRILETTPETIPAQIPYLAPPAGHEFKLEQLPETKFKVGLVWASGHKADRGLTNYLNVMLRESQQARSFPVAMYAGVLAIANVSFYSLQVGPNAAELVELGDRSQLQDLSPHIQDFADTAALISQMDLVISVDTAVAHLAGALGKPVWILLSHNPDWRWFLADEDTPWYPTLRLFRQSSPGDWTGVLAEVADALQGWVDR